MASVTMPTRSVNSKPSLLALKVRELVDTDIVSLPLTDTVSLSENSSSESPTTGELCLLRSVS